MRYISIIFALVIIASTVIAPPAEADTRYVGDQLVITLRMGKSAQHKILKTLKTGASMEVLEEEDPSYLKVRTSDGTEGYVLRQYISSNLPKALRIDELEIENSGLQKKISELQQTKISLEKQLSGIKEKYAREFSDLTTKSADYEQNLEQSLNKERIITEKYNTLMAQAENVVMIAQERDQLLQKNKKLTTGIKELRNEYKKASNSKMIKWFLAGGGVFFFGWIIGKISRKKRSRL
ncbi:MAG: TIGR04211 family SH3 domain-containing protein [Thermodesulfobacteriota bacterium]